ncbi:uncharacterized protein LOC123723535 [Papilio machaon]|uniref:uncharacterized protein LOC123723535 n=1 Tax=Papilio machaon TaxID=76193 RepID=UPI001E664639|nr:uncharacterized protein LOC123723535 [Papilio machaon]
MRISSGVDDHLGVPAARSPFPFTTNRNVLVRLSFLLFYFIFLFQKLNIRRFHHRRSSKSKSKYRLRDKYYDKSSSDSSAVDESESHERNPGNPYTVHKNHYKQNWMWNHVMTGDHMNVNPYAPLINNYGPSGAALIFGRKWWYFNQDDYKPL